MSTLLHIRSNGQITLPATLRRKANLNDGDLLEVVLSPDGILMLIPRTVIPKDQEYLYTPRWQAGEKEADADIQAGRIKKFDEVEKALDWLNRER